MTTPSNRDPDARQERPPQVMRLVNEQLLKRVHTSIPGIVQTYDAMTSRARVQPATSLMLRNGTNIPRATILDVPVLWQTNGRIISHMPLEQGDRVLLMFCERDISGFKQSGVAGALPSDRLMAEQDAVAIAGFTQLAMPVTVPSTYDDAAVLQTIDGETFIALRENHIRFQNPDVSVTITETDITMDVGDKRIIVDGLGLTLTYDVNDATSPQVLIGAARTTIRGAVTITGALHVDGAIDSDDTILADNGTFSTAPGRVHRHGGVQAGGDMTGAPA